MTTARILFAVARQYNVPPTALTSRAQTARLVWPRSVLAWTLREQGLSYPAIGRALHRDHSTAMAAVRRVQAEVDAGSPAGLGVLALLVELRTTQGGSLADWTQRRREALDLRERAEGLVFEADVALAALTPRAVAHA